MDQVLLLNNNYEPISIIGWKRAICLFALEKVEVVKTYEEEIASYKIKFNSPAVVRLLHSFKRPHGGIKFTKRNIFARDKWTCQYCYKEFDPCDLTIDHIIPKSRGGKTEWDNIVSCCKNCNGKKGNRTPREAGMKLKRIPIVPSWISIMRFLLSRKSIPVEWKEFCYFY
jgi:5-methylcytosine-specific restriction endonuclease McrA